MVLDFLAIDNFDFTRKIVKKKIGWKTSENVEATKLDQPRPTETNPCQPRPTETNRDQPRPTHANRDQPRPTQTNLDQLPQKTFLDILCVIAFILRHNRSRLTC